MAVNAKTAQGQLLQEPNVKKLLQEHSLVDSKVEVVAELPIPPKERFRLESVGDSKYVVIDEERKHALTFESGRLFETGRFTDFHSAKQPHSEINSDFLMDVHCWLSKYHPALVGK